MCNLSAQKTPFPQEDPRAQQSTLWPRAQELCQGISAAWQHNGWLLATNLWHSTEAIAEEALATAKAGAREDAAQRKQDHEEWAEQACQKGAGAAREASKPKMLVEPSGVEAPEGDMDGCPYSFLLAESSKWAKIWTGDCDGKETKEAIKRISRVLENQQPKTWTSAAERSKKRQQTQMACTPEHSAN